MATRKFPADILDQAINMQDAWAKIDEQLTVGGLSISALVTDINQIRQTEDNVVGLENDLTNMRNKRDALYEAAWDKVRRMRAAVKAIYGFDSPQYELVGGTRLSERKSPRRAAAVPAEPVQE
jgi:hypothetical protein